MVMVLDGDGHLMVMVMGDQRWQKLKERLTSYGFE